MKFRIYAEAETGTFWENKSLVTRILQMFGFKVLKIDTPFEEE